MIQKEWKLFMEWLEVGLSRLYNVTTHLDENKNMLYVFFRPLLTGPYKKLLIINMENKQCTFNKSDIAFKSAAIVCTKDHIHTIGYNNGTHYTFDKDTQKSELIDTFQQFQNMTSMKLVHIDSRNIILLFGVRNKGESIHCFRYCMVTQIWQEIELQNTPLMRG